MKTMLSSVLGSERNAIALRHTGAKRKETPAELQERLTLIRHLEFETNTTSWAWRTPVWSYPALEGNRSAGCSLDAMLAMRNEVSRGYAKSVQTRLVNSRRKRKPVAAPIPIAEVLTWQASL